MSEKILNHITVNNLIVEYDKLQRPTFFGFGKLTDHSVDQALQAFNILSSKRGTSGGGELNKLKKDSLDVSIADGALDLQSEIEDMGKIYYDHFNLDNYLPPLGFTGTYNLQKYPPGGGFHKIHCEKGFKNPAKYRELVWMVYLNDVDDGGETFWPFYNKKVKPEKGLAVFWPAYWMHAHHGIPSPTQEKYIATGWLFTPPY